MRPAKNLALITVIMISVIGAPMNFNETSSVEDLCFELAEIRNQLSMHMSSKNDAKTRLIELTELQIDLDILMQRSEKTRSKQRINDLMLFSTIMSLMILSMIFRKLTDSPPSLSPSSALSLLEIASLFVPKRLAEEEIGDAREIINGLDSRLKIYLVVSCTIFWVCINAIREITSALSGKHAPR
jgi:F0F1-type ATP synthase membrane subunit a